MKIVVIDGWNVGFRKVEFTKMLKSRLGYSLSDAKALTDAVVAEHRVELHVEDSNLSEFQSALNELGAKFSVKDQS
jgi:ribosomal protein L7/L12